MQPTVPVAFSLLSPAIVRKANVIQITKTGDTGHIENRGQV